MAMALSPAAAASWSFSMGEAFMRQPLAQAALGEDPAKPGHFVRFSCSAFDGAVLSFGFGAVAYESFAQFRAADQNEGKRSLLTLEFWPDGARAGAPLAQMQLWATPDVLSVAYHVFQTTGTEALAAARQMQAAQHLTILFNSRTEEFTLAGAREAIDEVLRRCPFAGG